MAIKLANITNSSVEANNHQTTCQNDGLDYAEVGTMRVKWFTLNTCLYYGAIEISRK